MKQVFVALCVAFLFLAACNSQKEVASPRREPSEKCPFSLSVVPEFSYGGGSIGMGHENPRHFFVVLTNISSEPQAVWEYWNSWGYQTVSFELTTADGKKYLVSKQPQSFTMNGPSTFLIEPGENQVYAIRLDDEWETNPALPRVGIPFTKIPVIFKAIYQVTPTPEATQYKVWTGRLESHGYNFSLRRW